MGKRDDLKGRTLKGGMSDPLINMEEGDNAKFLATALAIEKLGRVKKVDFTNYEECSQRIEEYFQFMIQQDQKPTMTGLAMALGVDRSRLYEILKDQPTCRGRKEGYTHCIATPQVRELIQGCVRIMTNLWEDYMLNGKINPASGIFIGKNFYGMRDEVEHVVKATENPVDNYSAEDIASRYISSESSSKKQKDT